MRLVAAAGPDPWTDTRIDPCLPRWPSREAPENDAGKPAQWACAFSIGRVLATPAPIKETRFATPNRGQVCGQNSGQHPLHSSVRNSLSMSLDLLAFRRLESGYRPWGFRKDLGGDLVPVFCRQPMPPVPSPARSGASNCWAPRAGCRVARWRSRGGRPGRRATGPAPPPARRRGGR